MIKLTLEEVKSIQQSYGDAFYIFNKDEFEENYLELKNTYRKYYENYHICYSYKTNYAPAICQAVKALGGYAEVVSDMEYELALKIGYTPEMIVYNGPIKGKYLEQHILNNGINNIDRMEEAIRICDFADAHDGKIIKTGIRVNFDIDAGYTSRFGIDINQVDEVINLLKAHNVEINGIHCHMSRARGIEAWVCRTETMLKLVKNELSEYNLKYISLGSGMYGHMDDELLKQFPGNIPNYEEYAIAVLKRINDYFCGKDYKPIVFTEPGTTIISKYVDFVAKVIGIKTIRDKQFILTNCSFHNLGEICQMKNIPMKVYSTGKVKRSVEDAKFVGYTCLEQDVVYHNFTGKVAIEDSLLFGNVGGYSVVDKPPFILPNYPMIESYKGEYKVIKEAETFDNIFSTFVF